VNEEALAHWGAVMPKERKFPSLISDHGHPCSILGVINSLVAIVLHFTTSMMN